MIDKDLSTSINKSKKNILLINSLLILLSLLLCLCFIDTVSTFKRLSSFTYREDVLISDIGDYFEASINVLKGINASELFEDLDSASNLLNFYIANPNGFIMHKVFVILIFVLAVCMIILPLILFGLSIYNFIKSKTTKHYNKFIIWFLFLSLLMVLFINAIDFGVGSGIILYTILSSLGVIFAIILQFQHMNTKNYILNLISFISIFALFFLSMVSFLNLFVKHPTLNNPFTANFGSVFSIFELLIDSNSFNTSAYSFLIEKLRQSKEYSFYFQYLIPIFQISAISLCLCALVLQLKKILFKVKDFKTHTILKIGFVLFLLFTITSTFYVSLIDEFIKDENSIYSKASINPLIYVVLAVFLIVYIYHEIFKKKINSNN